MTSASGPTALYHYFDSKQHCLYVILDQRPAELQSGSTPSPPSHADPRQALRAVCADCFELSEHEVLRNRVLVAEQALLSSKASSRSAKSRRVWRDASKTRALEIAWARFLADAMRQGAIPERDPRMLARAMLGLYNSIWHWYRPDQTLLLPTVAEFFTARMLAVAGVPPDGSSARRAGVPGRVVRQPRRLGELGDRMRSHSQSRRLVLPELTGRRGGPIPTVTRVVFGDEVRTHAELHDRAARLASALAAGGVTAARSCRAAAAQPDRVRRGAARVSSPRRGRRPDQLPPGGRRGRLHPRRLGRGGADLRRAAARGGRVSVSCSRWDRRYDDAASLSAAARRARRRRRGRPRAHVLHVGHDRPAEGRGADPPQPGGEHAELDPRDARRARTTCGSRASRCSTSAGSTVCCRSSSSGRP